MDYADTNFLVAVFFENARRTPAVERHLRSLSTPLVVGELAELECRIVFTRVEKQRDGEAWRGLKARIDRGEWRGEPVDWNRVSARTRDLTDRFSHRLALGSSDTLHIAAALEAGCARFLSFDAASNARVLAASARLAVWPELSPEEKSRVVR